MGAKTNKKAGDGEEEIGDDAVAALADVGDDADSTEEEESEWEDGAVTEDEEDF